MIIIDPPVRDNTIDGNNRFLLTWVRWFNSIKSILSGLQNTHGWAYYQDTLYTSGSPLNVNNTRTKITVNGLGAGTNTTYIPSNMTQMWDTTTNKIVPGGLGDSYILRVDFKAVSGTNNVEFDLELDIGSVIFEQSLIVSKGIGIEHRFSVAIPIYCLSTFVANGGELYINTPDNINYYDFGIFISRLSTAQ